jgi:hypothetical protein
VFDKNLNVLKWNLNVKIKNTIADYRFKSSMFGQNDWSMISGSSPHQRVGSQAFTSKTWKKFEAPRPRLPQAGVGRQGGACGAPSGRFSTSLVIQNRPTSC